MRAIPLDAISRAIPVRMVGIARNKRDKPKVTERFIGPKVIGSYTSAVENWGGKFVFHFTPRPLTRKMKFELEKRDLSMKNGELNVQ